MEEDQQFQVALSKSSTLPVPQVIELVGRHKILSSLDVAHDQAKWIEPPSDLIGRFCGLNGKRPESYLRFARKWGVLNLDSHGDPAPGWRRNRQPNQPSAAIEEHGWPEDWITDLEAAGYSYVSAGRNSWFEKGGVAMITKDNVQVEDTEHWQMWGDYARSILAISDQLHKNRTDGLDRHWLTVSRLFRAWDGDEIDTPIFDTVGNDLPHSPKESIFKIMKWVDLSSDPPTCTYYWRPSKALVYYETDRDWKAGKNGEPQSSLIRADDPARKRKERALTPDEFLARNGKYLALAVQKWISESDATPTVTWDQRLKVHVGGTGLFAALGMQLALGVSESRDVVFCDGCSTPYFAKRKPRSDRRNYCPTCQAEGVPERVRQREKRQRRRARKES